MAYKIGASKPSSAVLSARSSGDDFEDSIFLTGKGRELLNRMEVLRKPYLLFRETPIDPKLILPLRGQVRVLSTTAADVFHWLKAPDSFEEAWYELRAAGCAVLEAGIPDPIEKAYRKELLEAESLFAEAKAYLSSRKGHEPLIYEHLFELIGAALEFRDSFHLRRISVAKLASWLKRQGFHKSIVGNLLSARDELASNLAEAELEAYLAAGAVLMAQFPSQDYSTTLELSDSLRVEIQWRIAAAGR